MLPSRYSFPRSAAVVAGLLSVVGSAGLAVVGVAVPAAQAGTGPQSVTFTHSDNSPILWAVPDGVTHVDLEASGGYGGATPGFSGIVGAGAGWGADVQAGFDVTPGHDLLQLWIGEQGTSGAGGGVGGWGGHDGLRSGGDGGRSAVGQVVASGGGGGGATEVDLTAGGSVAFTPLLIAGGGGGGPDLAPGNVCGNDGIGGCGSLGLGQGASGFPQAFSGGGGAGEVGGQPNGYGCPGSRSYLCGTAGGGGQGGVGGHLVTTAAAAGGGGGGFGGGAGGSGGVGGGGAGGSHAVAGARFGAAPLSTDAHVTIRWTVSRARTRAHYVPLAPTRVLDTRDPAGPTHGAFVGAGQTVDLPIVGHGGVPASGVSAVALNLTETSSVAGGYVTAFPSGTARPTASNLNVNAAGQTVANLVVVPVGANGAISLFTSGGGQLVADVEGYFSPADTARDGRFHAVTIPRRILDTRNAVGVPGTASVPAGGSLRLQVVGAGSIPSAGVEAVAVNLTAVDAAAAGFVTVWPGGQTRPNASNLNLTAPGQAVANLVLVPVGADGSIDLYSDSGTHLVVDVLGWFTDATSSDSPVGLFVPVAPSRVLDTRVGLGRAGARAVAAGETIDVPALGAGGVPAVNVAAVMWNVTATGAAGPGYVTVWPTGSAQPTASTLNIEGAGQDVANLSISGIGAAGAVSLSTSAGTHLLADAAGYFLDS